jgi:hypothetical protein
LIFSRLHLYLWNHKNLHIIPCEVMDFVNLCLWHDYQNPFVVLKPLSFKLKTKFKIMCIQFHTHQHFL